MRESPYITSYSEAINATLKFQFTPVPLLKSRQIDFNINCHLFFQKRHWQQLTPLIKNVFNS